MTNLKRIIDEKGVQQRWLAEQFGVTEVSMSRYVNGERIPKAPLAIKMADVLGVDVKELYGWDDAHVIGENEAQPETHEERTETHSCDLISRQAAIDAFTHKWDGMVTSVFDVINSLPSAQPEIIRCKECVHADSFYHCDYMATWHDGECFCSHGKRRNDGRSNQKTGCD